MHFTVNAKFSIPKASNKGTVNLLASGDVSFPFLTDACGQFLSLGKIVEVCCQSLGAADADYLCSPVGSERRYSRAYLEATGAGVVPAGGQGLQPEVGSVAQVECRHLGTGLSGRAPPVHQCPVVWSATGRPPRQQRRWCL